MHNSDVTPGRTGSGPVGRVLKPLLVGVALFGLVACEDSEERAERYYQSAVALAEADDIDRALVELRNVFDNDGTHKEARRLYADLLMERGQVGDAYSHYLRLIEQYPDTVEVRRILAEQALSRGDWEEVRRHGQAAIELAPDAPESRALEAALAYREAETDGDGPAQAAAAEKARALVEEHDELMIARRILIDWLVQNPDPSRALPQLDAAIAQDPDSRQLRMARLAILDGQGERDAVGAELKEMYELFPDDEQISDSLISWYLATGDVEGAEAFLRQEAGPVDGAPEGQLAVVDMLRLQRGAEAALDELERLAEANADTDLGRLYATEAAALRFDTAESEAARQEVVARVQDIVAAAEGPERRADARMTLAQMQMSLGQTDKAMQLVDEVLEEDSRRVAALEMRARQNLRDGEAGAALSDLRLALDGAPRNAEILTLLAEAHRKSGNVELAGQRLAEAVEVSRNGVAESLNYARYLVERDRLSSAESVLRNAIDRAPAQLELRSMLGDILLRRGRFGELRTLANDLRQLESPEAARMARSLDAERLFRENRVDESLEVLEQQAGGEDVRNITSRLQMISLQVRSNRFEAARETLADLATQSPDSGWVEVVEADILAAEGETAQAIEIYRGVIEDRPEALAVRERLLRLLRSEGRTEEADALLDESLEALPDARSLRLSNAQRLERKGAYQEAISVYEALYEADPDDMVVANNLASLLSTEGTGEAALDRAYRIAQRLDGSDQPALLDTLGWVQLQRGDVEQAVRNLEAAARGLPESPTVAFDLGMAYAEAGRPEDARAEIERGMELAGDADVPQRDRAAEVLRNLDGGPAEASP